MAAGTTALINRRVPKPVASLRIGMTYSLLAVGLQMPGWILVGENSYGNHASQQQPGYPLKIIFHGRLLRLV